MAQLPPTVLPDTNFLLDYPAVHHENWLIPSLEILISETVISELRGLSNNSDPNRAKKARAALQEIEKFRGPLANLTGSLGVTTKIVARFVDLMEPLNPHKPDHQLIAYARKQHNSENPRFCAILSNDKELCDIAEALNVITISRQNEQRFHQELHRKYVWWEKAKVTGSLNVVQEKQIKKSTIRKPQPVKHTQLYQSVRKLYRRIEAVGRRTTLYLAPLKARLALTLEVIKRLRSPERQVVIIVVENKAMAHFWAGELRQMGKFSAGEVEVFGIDPAERLEQAKVVIYRHDQITRRFLQHVFRLEQAEKRITAVVDGCDLLDPVELAILLYECDQFIGLNHLPLGNRHTRGHRILNVILHNRALIDYSFADAERDGWGHSCDLYLSEIQYTDDERKIWDEINTDYLRRRDRAIREYPELSDSENFWADLDRLLDRSATPELVDILKQREQLEQMAQISQNKLVRVKQLAQVAPKQPYRRLIFDYTRQWTPVLLKQLGSTVAELPGGESQRKVWEQFSGSHFDTLLLSDVPAIDLPGANFHQLIILTPLRPMDEILSMIDWALSHTHTNDALRLDLLYVDDTPEEIAMIALAEASFDLRYP